MLSADDRKFICENYRNLSMRAIGLRLGIDGKTVKKAIIQAGFTPERVKHKSAKLKNAKRDFKCTPPESCFNCPFNDCIRDVAKAKPSQKEVDFRFIGTIDSVGRGNDRRRV